MDCDPANPADSDLHFFLQRFGARPPKGEVPFILFFLGGITTWSFINNNWMQSGHMIVKHIDLLDQVKLEAETIVVVKLIASLIEFVLNFLVFIVFSATLGYFPNATYLYLPIIIFFIILTTLGGMYFFSSLGVFVRDIPNVIGMALRLLFFVSGVLITPDMIPDKFQGILSINPLLHLIESLRSIIIYSQPPSLISFIYMGSFSLLAFLIGLTHFQKRKGIFVDYK
ncbi:MAG: ABC transporter permease [Anaerolineales bacterium]